MKKILLFALTAAVALGATSCAEKKNDIKVISYNVRVNNEGDGENKWDLRKHASVAMINEEKPTIFGLQEAKPEQMQYLVENLPQYGYIGVGREDGISSGEHMTIFYLKEEVELLAGGTFWLSETPEEPSMGWDAACKRSCTWTKLRMKDTGKEFAYINTHLDHVGKVAQREGLALICRRFAEIVPVGMPAFLTADFNAVTTDPIFEPLNAEMLDAREVAPETDRRGTFNGWGKRDSIIDYIYYKGFKKCSRYEVITRQYEGVPYISDH